MYRETREPNEAKSTVMMKPRGIVLKESLVIVLVLETAELETMPEPLLMAVVGSGLCCKEAEAIPLKDLLKLEVELLESDVVEGFVETKDDVGELVQTNSGIPYTPNVTTVPVTVLELSRQVGVLIQPL